MTKDHPLRRALSLATLTALLLALPACGAGQEGSPVGGAAEQSTAQQGYAPPEQPPPPPELAESPPLEGEPAGGVIEVGEDLRMRRTDVGAQKHG